LLGKEKVVGALMTLISVILVIAFFVWGILAPALSSNPEQMFWKWSSFFGIPVPPLYWVLFIPLFLAILLAGLLGAWIGVALVQSPEPTEINIEEIEKELEELEKEEEKEEKEEEAAEEGEKASTE